MDDNLWLIELESALLDDYPTVNEIFSICRGKSIPESLRPDVWQICLDVRHRPDQMANFSEIFDLPFQRELRTDCKDIVEKLGNEDEDKVSVVSDLESILTFYCKSRNIKYEPKNGWIELLLPLLALKLKRSDTFNLFESIRDTYIPKGCERKGNVFHLFRLLIQYHDPELCSMLDTKKISPDLYSISWFQSLFAATCHLPVVLSMWDLYFQQADPFLIFFLALTMLINGREQILTMKDDEKEKIVEALTNMPCALEQDDVMDFCSLAQYYNNRTPSSFKTDLLKILFGMEQPNESRNVDPIVAQALTLPVSVYELVDNTTMESHNPDGVKFFLVDCRPADQYNSGHLSTAFHLDSSLMLQDRAAFNTAIQGLLRAQKQAIEAHSNAGGEHLCFMGSGRVEEDQYMHMVVASFLQKNTQFVSLLTGGFAAIHDYFGDHMTDCLEDHNSQKCLVCSANRRNNNVHTDNKETESTIKRSESKPNLDLFSKISDTLKLKSAEVKDKLFDYIVNPTPDPNQPVEKHVLPAERNTGKRYRSANTAVFSIDDDVADSFLPGFSLDGLLNVTTPTNNQNSNIPSEDEFVQLPAYLKQPEVINSFKCQEVHMNGSMYDSYLILTKTKLVVLRELPGGKRGQIIARRALSTIVKITAKRRHKDLITFKYGVPDSENIIITDMDRFLIQNASQATSIISKHIVQQMEDKNMI